MRSDRVLVVDDDGDVVRSIVRLLAVAGYEAEGCTTRTEARRRLHDAPYRALVLDRTFPDGDGLDICRELRARRDLTPVLFLSAHGDDCDIIAGLEAGADDYVVKPIGLPVLRARLAALLRRSRVSTAIVAGPFSIDPVERLLTVRGPEPVHAVLSTNELRFLAHLARRPDRVVSRDVLIAAIWGADVEVSDNALDVVVLRLRRKLAQHANALVTVRGHGFELRTEPPPRD
jgi:DNA-binding response OmpR family regulator